MDGWMGGRVKEGQRMDTAKFLEQSSIEGSKANQPPTTASPPFCLFYVGDLQHRFFGQILSPFQCFGDSSKMATGGYLGNKQEKKKNVQAPI